MDQHPPLPHIATETALQKASLMSKGLIKEKPSPGPIVIADECGDSMWDPVFDQEVEASAVGAISENASSLQNDEDAVQVADAT